jgi:hypothetical protein
MRHSSSEGSQLQVAGGAINDYPDKNVLVPPPNVVSGYPTQYKRAPLLE